MRGRKPKPTVLKLVEGNPGRRRIDVDSEPQPDLALPECPDFLVEDAREEWHRMAKELFAMGLLTTVDRAALAGYCAAYGRFAGAERDIARNGTVVNSPNNYPITSPWVGVANRALDLMHKYLVEFGMTPSSRTRIKVPQATKAEALEQKYLA